MTDTNHSKQADAIPALDVPAGSIPVDQGDVHTIMQFCLDHAESEDLHADMNRVMRNTAWQQAAEHSARIWRYCAEVLRRHADQLPMRQPE